MNRVHVIVRNPTYVADVELDEDLIDPADLTPLVSGNTPIVTVPASETDKTNLYIDSDSSFNLSLSLVPVFIID